MKKTILFIIPLLLILMLTNCQKDQPDTSTETTTVPPMIELIKAGKCDYTVVYPDGADAATVNLAKSIKTELEKIASSPVKLESDWSKTGEYDDAALEILVGNTKHRQTTSVKSSIGYAEYAIRLIENKIVVTSWYGESLTVAVQQFVRQIRKQAEGNNLSMPADLEITGTQSKTVAALPAYTGGEPTQIINCGNGCYLLHVGESSKDEFEQYANELKKKGFELYTENTIGNNLSKTFVNDEYTLHATYADFDQSVRLTIETRGALPSLEKDNVYDKLVDSSITQIGLEFPMANGNLAVGGLSYVIQLSDGSFIIIDGGFNRDIDADRIYNVLREKAPDKNNITITGWFLSHAHSDHVGGFEKFATKYSGVAKVETFILNFPSTTETLAQGFTDEKNITDSVFSHLRHFPDAKVIKVHTGQKFFMKNAVIDILYTLDDLRPASFADFNETSLVLSVKIEGQRLLFLTDAHTNVCNLLVKMYREGLKSDFVQLAHHGSFNAATPQLYELVRPSVVLWPAGNNTYKSAKKRPENMFLLSLDTVKEVHLAADTIITIPLPWSPES